LRLAIRGNLSAIRVTTPIATLMFSAEYSPNGELSSVRTPVQPGLGGDGDGRLLDRPRAPYAPLSTLGRTRMRSISRSASISPASQTLATCSGCAAPRCPDPICSVRHIACAAVTCRLPPPAPHLAPHRMLSFRLSFRQRARALSADNKLSIRCAWAGFSAFASTQYNDSDWAPGSC